MKEEKYKIDPMRLKYSLQSVVAVKFRPIFNFVYKFKVYSSKIASRIYYEAYLYTELGKVINTDLLDLFKYKKRLPDNYGIGLGERIVELPLFLSQISESEGLHFDAGSALNYKDILFHKKLRNKKIIIGNLNPERNCYWTSSISYIYEDLRKSVFADNYFDSISCISTLEHVGLDNRSWIEDKKYFQNNDDDYLLFIGEFKRILKQNGQCFITVPFRKNRKLGWLQIFNKKMIEQIITKFQPSDYEIFYYKYDKNGWQLSKEHECSECGYSTEYPGQDLCVGAYSVACIKLVK
jgi:hypothetical protein